LDPVLELDAIDDDVEIVGARTIELDLVAEVDDGPVDADANEAIASQAFELELELAFAGANDRRENGELGAVTLLEDAIDDLLDRLRLDLLSAARAVRHAYAGEEKAEVIGDLGDCAHGRARRLGERSLLDGDGRREPFDG